jgi:phospholipid/cholesterol/gamma-HCH transport system substrate-binding protein
VLEGTTAEIHSVSLAGANEIQLNGAERGRPAITHMGPQGCPVIPASASGLSALLNSAPELLARIQRLTERLTELLNDKNQNAIADILENIDATTAVIRKNAPEMAATLQEARIAAHNAAIAANNIAALSNNANNLVSGQGAQAVANLNKAIVSAGQAADNLNAIIGDARPGMQNFSKSTLPEANRLVRDLRELTESMRQVSDRINRQGIGGALGPQKLPDYKPGKRQ